MKILICPSCGMIDFKRTKKGLKCLHCGSIAKTENVSCAQKEEKEKKL